MEQIVSFLATIDERLLIVVSLFVVFAIVFCLIKKAFKTAAVIFVIAFVFSVFKPALFAVFKTCGVEVNDSIITVETNSGKFSFDVDAIENMEFRKNDNKTEITVHLFTTESKTFTVSTTAASMIKISVKVVAGIAKAGDVIGEKYRLNTDVESAT